MSDPKKVAVQFVNALETKNYGAWKDIVDENVVMRFPFSPPGLPTEMTGRENCMAMVKGLFDHIERFKFLDVDVHATDDPELAVATARSEVKLNSGVDYANQYCFFYRVRNGKLVAYSEFFNPLPAMKSFGFGQ